jgi:thioredoxin 1
MGQSPDNLWDQIRELPAVVIYLSNESCTICKVLRPKVEKLVREEFAEIKFIYIDVKKTPDLAALFSVFTIPTVIAYFEGKEFFRKARAFGISELATELQRPYDLLFK